MAKPLLAATLLQLAALPALALVAPPGVPDVLKPSPAQAPAFMLSAEGAHVFECKPGGPGGFTWAFVAPDATLYDGVSGVATQTVPNLWESTSDRSSATGVVLAARPAGSGNLPWALLGARGLGETGLFAGVTDIQRVNTAGGVAPVGGCDDSSVGSELRVPFTADYYFYRPTATG